MPRQTLLTGKGGTISVRYLAILIPLLVPLLSACGPGAGIQVEVVRMDERDHWSLGGNKTCTISYKLLNNSGHPLTRLNASLVWRDAMGKEEISLAILETPLPNDKASQVVQTPPIFGHCRDISFVEFRDVLRCEAGPSSGRSCADQLQLIYAKEVKR